MELKCKTSGEPTPSTMWYKDGKELNSSSNERIHIDDRTKDLSQLKIESVQTSDKGSYTCVARNDSGRHKCTVTLTVEGNRLCDKCVTRCVRPFFFASHVNSRVGENCGVGGWGGGGCGQFYTFFLITSALK